MHNILGSRPKCELGATDVAAWGGMFKKPTKKTEKLKDNKQELKTNYRGYTYEDVCK